MRDIDLTKVIVHSNEDPTQQRSSFETGVNKFAPNVSLGDLDVNAIQVSQEPDIRPYVYRGTANEDIVIPPDFAEQAWLNFSMTKDMIELDMWKGMKLAKQENDGSIPSEVAKALSALAGEDFIANRIKANEIDMQQAMEELRPLATDKDAEINFTDALLDPKHFFGVQLPRVVGGMAGLMAEPLILGVAAGAATSWAGGSGGVAAFVGGLTSMLASRPFESIAEANAAYEETYRKALEQNPGDELQAKEKALKAFHYVYNDNMKLQAFDAAEVALAMTPVTKILSPHTVRSAMAANRALRNTARIAKYGAIAGKESWEEGYQYISQAEGENIGLGTQEKKTGWAELLYDEDEEGKEFAISIKGGALGGVFMSGAFASVPRIMKAMGMMARDINDKDAKNYVNEQQENMQLAMVARAVMSDQLPELEGRIMKYGRSNAMNNNQNADTEEKEAHKNSVQVAKRKVDQLRAQAEEFETLRKGLKKVKDPMNLLAAYHNAESIKKAREKLAKLKEDDPLTKEEFDEQTAIIKEREALHERFKKGEDVYRKLLKSQLINNQGIIGVTNKVATAPAQTEEAKPKSAPSKFKPIKPSEELKQEQAEQQAQEEEKTATQIDPDIADIAIPTNERREAIKKYHATVLKDEQEIAASITESKKVETPLIAVGEELPVPRKEVKLKERNRDDGSPSSADINAAEFLADNNLLDKSELEILDTRDSRNELDNVIRTAKERLNSLIQSSTGSLQNKAREVRARLSSIVENSWKLNDLAFRKSQIESEETLLTESIDSMTVGQAANKLNSIDEIIEKQQTAIADDEKNLKGRAMLAAKVAAKKNFINILSGIKTELEAHIAKKEEETKNKVTTKEPVKAETKKAAAPKSKNEQEVAKAKKRAGKKGTVRTEPAKEKKKTKVVVPDTEAGKTSETKKPQTDEKGDEKGRQERLLKDSGTTTKPVSSEPVEAQPEQGTPQADYKEAVTRVANENLYVTPFAKLIKAYLVPFHFMVTSGLDRISMKESEIKTTFTEQLGGVFIKIGEQVALLQNKPDGFDFSQQELNNAEIELRLKKPEENGINVVKTISGDLAFQYLPDGPLHGPRIEVYANNIYIGTVQELFAPIKKASAIDKRISAMEKLIKEQKKKVAKSRKAAKDAGPLDMNTSAVMFGVPTDLKKAAVKMKPVMDEIVLGFMESNLTILQAVKRIESFADELYKNREIDKKQRNAIVRFLRKIMNMVFDTIDRIRRKEDQELETHQEEHLLDQLLKIITSDETLANQFRENLSEQTGNIRYSSEQKYLQNTEKVRRMYDRKIYDPETHEMYSEPIRDINGNLLLPDEVYGKIFAYIHNTQVELEDLQAYFLKMPDPEIGKRLADNSNEDLNSLVTVVKSSILLRSVIMTNYTGKWATHQENAPQSSRDRVSQLKALATATMDLQKNPNYDQQFQEDFNQTMKVDRLALESQMDREKTKEKKLEIAHKWYDLVTGFLESKSGIDKSIWIGWAESLAKKQGYNMYEKLVSERKATGMYKFIISDVLFDSNEKYKAFKTPAERFRSYIHKGFIIRPNAERGNTLKSLAASIRSANTGGIAITYRGVTGNTESSSQFRSELTDLLTALEKGNIDPNTENVIIQTKSKGKSKILRIPNLLSQAIKNKELVTDYILFGGYKNSQTKIGIKQNRLSKQDFLIAQLNFFAEGVDNQYYSFVQQQADDSSKYFVKVPVYDLAAAKLIFKSIKEHPEIPSTEQIKQSIALVESVFTSNEETQAIYSKAVNTRGQLSADKMAELFVYNDIINRFFINEYLTPKYAEDAQGRIIENYGSNSKESLRQLGKRKQDMKGMSMLVPIVGEKIKQLIISDPNEVVTLGKDDPKFTKTFSTPFSDGTIFITESLADRANLSLGGIFDFNGTFKLALSDHNKDRIRTVDKANFITLTKKTAERYGGYIQQLYNIMNDPTNPVDIVAFSSGVKMKNPHQVVNLEWTKEGDQTVIDTDSLKSITAENIIELPSEALRMQVDLQRNPTLEDGKAPNQIFYHIRDMKNWPKIRDIRNQLVEVLESKINAEFLSKTADEKREYLLENLPISEQTESLIEVLKTPGISMANPKVREAYNSAVKQIITRKLLGVTVNRGILIDLINLTGRELGDMVRATYKDVQKFKQQEANPKLNLKVGDTKPPGTLVPKSYRDKNGIKAGEYIFVTRVPVSAKHSHTLVQVEGFIEDESLGNVIIINGAVEKIAGADFDGDVRYIWSRYQDVTIKFNKTLVTETIDKIQRLGEEIASAANNEKRAYNKLVSLRKAFSSLPYTLQKAVEQAVAAYLKQAERKKGDLDNTIVEDVLHANHIDPEILKVEDLETLSSIEEEDYHNAQQVVAAVDELILENKSTTTKVLAAKNFYLQQKGKRLKAERTLKMEEARLQTLQKAAANEIFDLMANDWMDPDNRDAITDPIDTDTIQKEGGFLYRLMQSSSSQLKVYDLQGVLQHISDVQEGEEVIGVLARTNAAYGFMREAKMDINSKFGPRENPGIHLPEFEDSYTDQDELVIVAKGNVVLNKFDHSSNPEKQKTILQTIANNLNHSVDNIKNGLLSFLGLNKFTANLKSTLLFLGMTDKSATFMMHHPVMQQLVQADKQKQSPLNNSKRRSAYNELASSYANELIGSLDAKVDATDPISKIAQHGLWEGRHNINVAKEALGNPPTAEEWNLATKSMNSGKATAKIKVFNAKIKTLRYIQALKSISDEIFALGNLTKLLEEAPNGMAEVSNYNQSLERLGYSNENTLRIEYDQSKTIIDHKDFWNSEAMKAAKRSLTLADVAASETVSGSRIGRDIVNRITSWINESYHSKSEFLRNEDYELVENALEKVILKIAMNIGTREVGNEAIIGELFESAKDAYYEEKIDQSELGEYIKIFTDADTDKSFIGLDPSAKGKFTQSHHAKRLRQQFSELSEGTKEKILKYHIVKYGYNNTTEKIGGFGVLFDFKTDQMISSAMDRVLKFLQHEQDVYRNSLKTNTTYKSKYKNAIDQIALAVMLESDELLPLAYKAGDGYLLNGRKFVADRTMAIKVVSSSKERAQKRDFEPFVVISTPESDKLEKIAMSDLKENNTYNPFGSTIYDDMVEAGILDIQTTLNESELHYMLEAGEEQLAKENEMLTSQIAEKLAKVFRNIEVFNDPIKFQEFLDKHFPGQVLDLKALGAAIGAAIYVNPEKAVQSTQAHEYIHPYYDLLPDNHFVKRQFRANGMNDEQAVTAIGKAIVEIAKKEANQNYEKQDNLLIGLIKEFWNAIKKLFTPKNQTKELTNDELALQLANEIWNMDSSVDTSQQLTTLEYMMPNPRTGKERIANFLETIDNHVSRISKSLKTGFYIFETTAGTKMELTSPTTELKFHRKYIYNGKEVDDPDTTYTDNGTAVHSFAEYIIQGMAFDKAFVDSGLSAIVSQDIAANLETQIQKWMADNLQNDEIVKNEQLAASVEYNIATRIDMLSINPSTGKARVFDFKTSKHSTLNKTSGYFVRTLGSGTQKRSLYDRHSAQLHMESQILEFNEPAITERTGIPVTEQIIVPIHLKYDSNEKITQITIEPNIDATGNLEAKVDANEMLSQKRDQGIHDSIDRLSNMVLVSRDQYFAQAQIPYDEYLIEFNQIKDVFEDEDEFESLSEDQQVIYKKRYRAVQIMMDKALAEYDKYTKDFKFIKKFITEFEARVGQHEEKEILAALSLMEEYDSIAQEKAVQSIREIYANALYGDPEQRTKKDMSAVDVEMQTHSNVSQEYADIQKAMLALQTAEQIIENEFQHYKVKSTELTKKLVKESDVRLGKKDLWLRFWKGTYQQRYAYFKNMIEDGKIKEATDPSLTPTEKEWLMFHQHGQTLDANGIYVADKQFIGYHGLALINGVIDPMLFSPAHSMGYEETVARYGHFRAVSQGFLETRTAKEVIVRFKDPITGAMNEGTMSGALLRFEKQYTTLGGVFTKPNKEQKKLLKELHLLSKKVNKAVVEGKNLDERRTPIKETFKEVGFIMQDADMQKFNAGTSRYWMDQHGRLMSRSDRRMAKDVPISGDLFSTYNASVYDRMYTKHMRQVMPMVLATQSAYQGWAKTSVNTTKPYYKNLNKWYDLLVRHSILQEKFVDTSDFWDKKVSQLRYWTYAKIMAFNFPVAIANLATGFMQTIVNIGFRKWMVGFARYAGNLKKARRMLEKYRIVSIPHVEDFASGAISGFEYWANVFTREAENLIQGANVLAYLTKEQWENHDASGELTPQMQKEYDRIEDLIAADQLDPKGNSPDAVFYRQNFLSHEDTANLKKRKNDIQGYYDIRDQGNYARSTIMKAIMMFKTWLPAVLKIHFGEHNRDIYGNEMKGIYRSMFDEALVLFGKKDRSELTKIDVENRKKFIREITFGLIMFGAYNAMWDDDDKERKRMARMLEYMANQMFAIQQPLGWAQTIESQAAPMHTISDAIKALYTAVTFETYKIDGVYGDKGDLKGPGKIMKSMPFNNILPARMLGIQKYMELK